MSKQKLEREIKIIQKAINITEKDKIDLKKKQQIWIQFLDTLSPKEINILQKTNDLLYKHNPDLYKVGYHKVKWVNCHGLTFIKTVPYSEMPQYWHDKLTPEENKLLDEYARIYLKLYNYKDKLEQGSLI